MWVGEWGENNYDAINKTLYIFEKKVNFCGWTLWTWKRTPYGDPPQARYVPLSIKLTPGMKTIINRLEGRINSFPDNFDVISSLDGFINNFKPENCDFDKKLINILNQYR